MYSPGLCQYWHLTQKAVKAINIYEKEGPAQRGGYIPHDLHEALKDLHVLLTDRHYTLKERYGMTLCASPPLRKFRYRDDTFGATEILPAGGLHGDKAFSLLTTILNEQQSHLWTLTRLYDELDMTVSASPKERDLISSLLSQVLSQRATVDDALTTLENHRPTIEQEDPEQKPARYHQSAPLMLGFAKNTSNNFDLHSVAFPTSRFRYPKGQKTVDDAMSAFWVAAEKEMLKKLLPVRRRHNPTEPASRGQQPVLPYEIGIKAAPAPMMTPPKAKVKRRGEALPADQPGDEPPPVAGSSGPSPQVVSARVWKALRSVFRMAS
ncbi:hypothetical protein BV25DRAFT_1841735 [Artomyces pyxidatus]|uniref:Uncharacterized protein n=1 Tax=Artomyces pyxidatus TaxID=48021 RepID=A0ACB8SM38_9AGAM|nr:hypothetical protein BV25DRAFT_1841735 [Artomyces pyxidatus]